MKYNDNGEYKDIYVKAFDTLPVGTEVDYDGNTAPTGWIEVPSKNLIISNLNAQTNMSITTAYSLVKIPLNNEYLKIGNKLTFDSTNNCIVVGTGVNHIRIGSQIYVGTFSNNQAKERIFVISKNNEWTTQVCDLKAYTSRDRLMFNQTSCIIPVSEGDTISLKMASEVVETCIVYGDNSLKSFLMAEVVD